MIAFLSPKQARAWYESTAYRADSADSFQLREVSRVHRRKRPSTGRTHWSRDRKISLDFDAQ
ncbi:hypothetical protein CKY39_10270 [Variovorax boronicumulans]|uniref:Uncharacterized protein n=1 Tax=Variovorax boronicumulans TaxID=436515 RepID=A0A250DGR5_9BURK|nr:hypothetical protein CKY39_10270 [Variovorax boronicumulans]